jgi:hypothetical protein
VQPINKLRFWKDKAVITHLIRLVAKEMDLIETLILDMSQTIGLVPPRGEDVKRDLTADGVGEIVLRELLPQDLYKGSPDSVNLSERV